MLDAMDSGAPFSVEYVKFDYRRKRGGQIQFYPSCIILKNEKKNTATKPADFVDRGRNTRNPHHYEHSTRSFSVVINGTVTSTIKKLHIYLVLSFNGKKLIL